MRTVIVIAWISLAVPSIWAAQHSRKMVSPSALTPSGVRAKARLQNRAIAGGAAATLAQAPGVVQLEYLNGTVLAWFVTARTIPKGSTLAFSVSHANGSGIDCDSLNVSADVAAGQSYLLPNVNSFGDLWSSGLVTYAVYVTTNGQETQAAADFAVDASRNFDDLQQVLPLIASASQNVSSGRDVILTIRGAFSLDAPYVALDDAIVPTSAVTVSTTQVTVNLSRVPGLDLSTFREYALTVGQGGWSDTIVYRYLPAAPGSFNPAP
jgi:hypothetical protein